jgi:iron(III) transport system substrate-binding protein
VAKGEVGIGVSFLFGFDKWRHDKFPVKTAAPCEGTGYEVGGIALIKSARNKDNAKRHHDWLMSAAGQAIGAQTGSLQSSANKTFEPDPRIPSMADVKLIKYDFEKYGKAAERKRLIERWTREVEAAAAMSGAAPSKPARLIGRQHLGDQHRRCPEHRTCRLWKLGSP